MTNLTPEDILGDGSASAPYNGTSATRNVPRINIDQPYGALAACVAENLPDGVLYRRNGEYVTVSTTNDSTGYREDRMTPGRFSTWVERHLQFFKYRGKEELPKITSLSEAQSKLILASDDMLERVPEIKEISSLRLPVLKEGTTFDRPIFEPAAVGYDPRTRIYTVDSLPVNWHQRYSAESVRKVFLRLFQEFPLDSGDIPHSSCRSMGAIVCAMLGLFLRHNIDRFPIIIFNANQRGTGKTFLARCILSPFYGEAEVTPYIEDDTEMRKTLNANIQSGEPYCLLDDVRSLVSNSINRVVTASKIRDRKLGGDSMFCIENRMQFFVTGNQLKTSQDVERRSMPIDMFLPMDATKRQVENIIDEVSILKQGWRKEMLEALWSLVCGWMAAGCPKDPQTSKRITSFSAYQVATHITIWAGFMDPFGPRQVNLDTGDTMSSALEEVVIHVADGVLPPPGRQHTGYLETFKIQEILERAQAIDKLEIVTNGARDEKRSFGQQMRKIKGRIYTDSMGRQFMVGDKKTKASSAYTFTILSEPLADMFPALVPGEDDFI